MGFTPFKPKRMPTSTSTARSPHVDRPCFRGEPMLEFDAAYTSDWYTTPSEATETPSAASGNA